MAAFGETIVARSTEREKETAPVKLKIATVPIKFSLGKWREYYLTRFHCKCDDLWGFRNLAKLVSSLVSISTVSSLQPTVMRPQSLMHAACVLGLIFPQTRNEIP